MGAWRREGYVEFPVPHATVIAHQGRALVRALGGHYDEAILDLREVLAIAEATLEPYSSFALELRADLAIVLAAAGQARESAAEFERVIAAEPPRWRELVAAGRFAIALGQEPLAEQMLSLALERAGEPEDESDRHARALAKLALADLWVTEDPGRAAAILTTDLDEDLRDAQEAAAALTALRRATGR